MYDFSDNKRGNDEKSAKQLEKQGDFLLAAQKYYEEDDFFNSAKMYRRAGFGDRALVVLENGGFFSEASDMAEDIGRIHLAARYAEMAGDYARALEIYSEIESSRDIERVKRNLGRHPQVRVRAPGVIGGLFLVFSLFFLSSNITGGFGGISVGEFNALGSLLFVFGLIGILIWAKENGKQINFFK